MRHRFALRTTTLSARSQQYYTGISGLLPDKISRRNFRATEYRFICNIDEVLPQARKPKPLNRQGAKDAKDINRKEFKVSFATLAPSR
jgi:hypothetical protein